MKTKIYKHLLFLSLTLFFAMPVAVSGQTDVAHSNGSAKDILKDAVQFSGSDKNRALEAFSAAIEKAKSTNDDAELFNILRERGYFFEDNNQLEAALSDYLRAQNLAQKSGSSPDLLSIYTDLAIVSRKMARYIDCKNYHTKALELAERTGDQEIIEDSYHGLGFLYEQIGDYEKAVSSYLKSLELTQKRGGKSGEIVTLQQIGKTYSQLNQRELALQNIQQAETLAISTKSDSILANVQHDFGEILVQFGEYEQALVKLNHALTTYRKIDYRPGPSPARWSTKARFMNALKGPNRPSVFSNRHSNLNRTWTIS